MLTIVFFSVLVVCAAQVPTRCDGPLQFESRLVREDRRDDYTKLNVHAHDGVNRRTYTREEVIQGKERNFYLSIKLYNENKEYKMDLRTKKCNVTAPTRPFTPVGVPIGAHFLFESEVGPAQIPNEHLTATAWDGTFEDGRRYFVMVTYPDCIPISFDIYNNKTGDFVRDRHFDVKAGISDPGVFIPPSECMG